MFNNIGLLVNDLLEQFVIKDNEEIKKASAISKEIRNKLETDFEINLSPEIKIQIGEEEEEIEIEPKRTEFSTPLKIEEKNETCDREKEDYLRTALKINEIDLETAAEVADEDNEAIIDEIINPTPGLVVDNDINVDTQFDFRNSDLDTSFTLPNTLQERIDDILENARKKVSSFKFPGEATEDIPNDPLYPLSQIKTEDIYIDDSLRDMLYPGDRLCFAQPSTDNRRDFELNVTGDDMIILKSPALTFAAIEKKDLKNVLNKIMENLKLNIKQLSMPLSNKSETEQKITLLKNLTKRFSTIKKADIEKQLISHQWLNKLIEDELIADKSYYKFGENFEGNELKNKFKNVTIRKRKLLPLTSEDRLKDLSSIYTKIPTDKF